MSAAPPNREVIYLWPYHEWGGVQIYFFGLMKLVSGHYPVRAMMPTGSSERLLQYLRRLDVPVEFFDGRIAGSVNSWSGRVRRRWEKVRCEWLIARRLGKLNLRETFLHLDIAPWGSFWLLLYLSLRSNVFVTLHTPLPELGTLRYVSWLFKFRFLNRLRGFHLLTSNRNTLESLRSYLPESALRRIPIAYSGVDLGEVEQVLAAPVDRIGSGKRYEFPPEAFLVMALGQFVERKGCDTLLEAARELRNEHPQLFYVWIGTDDLSAESLHQIEISGVADRFRYVSGRELGGERLALLQLLRLADVYVLPSRQEGLPIALLEAMALGKACIASDINAIPEAITDGQTGILIPPNDGGALAEAISELVNDEPQRKRLAKAAQELTLTQFNERMSAEITLDCYENSLIN